MLGLIVEYTINICISAITAFLTIYFFPKKIFKWKLKDSYLSEIKEHLIRIDDIVSEYNRHASNGYSLDNYSYNDAQEEIHNKVILIRGIYYKPEINQDKKIKKVINIFLSKYVEEVELGKKYHDASQYGEEYLIEEELYHQAFIQNVKEITLDTLTSIEENKL